jgi:hypothetical protein
MNVETLARIKELHQSHTETLNAWRNSTDMLKKAFAETVLKIEVR